MDSDQNKQFGVLVGFAAAIAAVVLTGLFAPPAVSMIVAAVTIFAAAAMVLSSARGRDQAEAELGKTSALQRAILESASFSIISIDLHGTITSVNKAAEQTLRYTADELVGKRSLLNLHDAEEIQKKADELEREADIKIFTMPALEKGVHQSEWTQVRKDGTRFPVELTISSLENAQGALLGYVAIAVDVTDQLDARRRLHQYVHDIEEAREDLSVKNRLLEEFAEELKTSRDEAVSATNTKSEFLANMSHEIRTPMNGVLGTTHLLLNTDLSEKQRSYVQLIHRSSESLLGILNDILDLSKMEAGKMVLETEPFDLRETAEDVCEQFAPVAHQKGIELNLVFPTTSTMRLVGDSARLRQIFTNLVANAIKFTEKGEVNVLAQMQREDAGTICYRFGVRDTGIGIPQERVESIFESFAQADGNTARRYGGTGLGLAISRQLVELMQGQIGAVSSVGQGSEFWFEVTFEKQKSEAEPVVRDLGGITVLVAEDNDTSRMAIQALLESWNCKVNAVPDGKAASDAIARENFDCAVIDMLMPHVDGLELARSVRKSKRTRDLPIVLVSAAHVLPNDEDIKGLFQAVLSKPVRAAQFYDSVARAVNIGIQESDAAAEPTTEKTLAKVRVLVVEDNPINQLVVTEMLKSWECTVVAVDNGRKAVDRLAVDLFDIVLMDMQMPEMDGLEASRTIRQREKGTKRHIPIVAMTANAMKGDEERCLEAGMDAYLSKPIQPARLAETMERYAGHEVKIEPEAPKAEPAEVLPAFDIEQLHQTTSTSLDIQQRVLERYLESLSPNVAQLDDAVKLLDRTQIRSICHSLKGSSWTVGALALADVCRQLEAGSASLGKQELEDLVLDAEKAIEAARAEINTYLQGVANAA